MSEWFENPHFWEQLEPFLFHQIRSKQDTKREVLGIIKLLNLNRGEAVVDLGCGIGRHTLELARRGFEMTGVDITKDYLQKTGSQAKKQGLSIDLIKEDFRHFVKENKFDGAISMFSSFGYFSNQKHDFQVLKNIFDSLKSGGRVLLDLMGREVLRRHLNDEGKYQDERTGAYLVQNSIVHHRWEWVEHNWTVIHGSHQKTFNFGIRVYSGDEITQALKNAGFDEVKLYGTFEGAPYNHDSSRLLVTGWKRGK